MCAVQQNDTQLIKAEGSTHTECAFKDKCLGTTLNLRQMKQQKNGEKLQTEQLHMLDFEFLQQ